MWVIKTANVFLDIFLMTWSISIDKFSKLASTKTGLNPFIITEATSDIQVSDGTIISFFFLSLFECLSIDKVIKFADAPEFTNVENIEKKIKLKEDLFGRKFEFQKILDKNDLPKYITENEKKFSQFLM